MFDLVMDFVVRLQARASPSPCFHILEYQPLNWIAPYLLAPLLGVPPGMYRLHHCIMHHGGNNRWQSDASSTERYQRDSLYHFFLCVGRRWRVWCVLVE